MDIFHYDSQFFTTLKYLLIRPGFLTREYMAGRRVRYVNPIKLYVFVSFVFFFTIFGILGHTGVIDENNLHKTPAINVSNEDNAAERKKDSTANATDATRYHYKPASADSTAIAAIDSPKHPEVSEKNSQYAASAAPLATAHRKKSKTEAAATDSTKAHKSDERHDYLKEYDEAQAKLTPAEQDKGLSKFFTRRLLKAGTKLQSEHGDINADEIVWESFKHNAPKFMFVLMPLFALMMKWLYARRKQFMYADHAIFALHFHSFAFMLFLIAGVLAWIFPIIPAYTISFWILFAYQTLGLYKNYGQSFRRSLFKSVLLTIAYFFIVTFVMALGGALYIGLIV
nr:DUF3667 domain-containing protein [Chitinophaga sp. Cy-1792]